MQHCLTYSEPAIISDWATSGSLSNLSPSLYTNIPPSAQRERLRSLFYCYLEPQTRDFTTETLQSYSFHSMVYYFPDGLPYESEYLAKQVFPFKARSKTCRGQWFRWTRQRIYDWNSHTVWFYVEDIELELYKLPVQRGFIGIPMLHSSLPSLLYQPLPCRLQIFRYTAKLLLWLRWPIQCPEEPIELEYGRLRWDRTEVWYSRNVPQSDQIQVWVDNSPVWSTRPSGECAGESSTTLVDGKGCQLVLSEEQLREALLPDSITMDHFAL